MSDPKLGEPGWIGHEWKSIGWMVDKCIHCGFIARDGDRPLPDHLHCAKMAELKAQSESKTPETDKAAFNVEKWEDADGFHITHEKTPNGDYVYADAARKLETERDEARAELPDARASGRRMHRRAQKAERQAIRLRGLFNHWKGIAEFWHREFHRHHGIELAKAKEKELIECQSLRKMLRDYVKMVESLESELTAANAARAENRRLREALGFATHIVTNFVNQLPSRRDWLDPDLERMAKGFLAEAALSQAPEKGGEE